MDNWFYTDKYDKSTSTTSTPTFLICIWTCPTKNAKTSIQVFQLMFTAIILQSIVQQTKLFVSQKGIELEFG